MKRLIILFLLIPAITNAQQDFFLPLEKDRLSGLYHMDASLNGLNGNFIFDTGASGIVINGSFYNKLLTGGQITRSDYKGPVRSIIADGSVVEGSLYNINKLETGNLVLHNVEVTVMPRMNAGMLIGQSFLAQFGKVTLDFDNSRLILTQKTIDPATIATSVDEIRIIPCFATSENFDELKKTLNASGITIGKYTQESKVPPATALQRINSSYTVRYFDAETENLSRLLSQKIAQTDPNSTITIEDMRPYFNGSIIPAYIEIWIK
ncbi:MAG: retropepsin-like aspartic protease [Cyclobacteriaceae bacterium]